MLSKSMELPSVTITRILIRCSNKRPIAKRVDLIGRENYTAERVNDVWSVTTIALQ
jgi:hypothetical protein